jgi:hypothetical protein
MKGVKMKKKSKPIRNKSKPMYRNEPSVYIIRDGKGPFKIGFTVQVKRRMRNINVVSDSRITMLCVMPGDKTLEEAWHKVFAHWQVDHTGSYGQHEWFLPPTKEERKEVIRFFKRVHAKDNLREEMNQLAQLGACWELIKERWQEWEAEEKIRKENKLKQWLSGASKSYQEPEVKAALQKQEDEQQVIVKPK